MSFDIASVKTKPEYKTYLSDLLAYLKDFSLRAQPLVDIDASKGKHAVMLCAGRSSSHRISPA